MNNPLNFIKGLTSETSRALSAEGRVMAKAIAGKGIKGYYLPTALGAVAGGGIAAANRSLDGAQGTRGTANSIWKGILYGGLAGAGLRAGRSFYKGGGFGSLKRIGQAAAFDGEFAYQMGKAQFHRFAGPNPASTAKYRVLQGMGEAKAAVAPHIEDAYRYGRVQAARGYYGAKALGAKALNKMANGMDRIADHFDPDILGIRG